MKVPMDGYMKGVVLVLLGLLVVFSLVLVWDILPTQPNFPPQYFEQWSELWQ